MWLALYTRSRHEKQVCEEIRGRNIEVFLPLYKARRRWSDRFKIVEEPLFKNYVFVNPPRLRIRETLRSYGALSIVMFDGGPAVIPDSEIESLRLLVEKELPFNPHPYLKIGRRVRVREGPLSGAEGILVRKKSLSRLVLSIHLLQRSVETEIDASAIEPI